MQIKFRSTIRSMVRNIKESFPPKPRMRKKLVLQDPGHVKDVEDALLHAACCMCSVQDIPIIL